MPLSVSILFIIFGLLIGSFLNVVIIRLPQKKDLVYARSACPKCFNQLNWYHNIPVLSYVLLRGKCSFCGNKISLRYPIIELLTSLISYLLMPDSLDGASIANFLFFFTVACIFLCHLVIDLEHHLLLDSLNIYLLANIFLYVSFSYSWQFWVSGGLIGFGAPLLVTWLFYKIRGQVGLGGGDIKLFGILGLLFGPLGILFNIFLSCLVGAIFGGSMIVLGKMTKDRPMAFGPAIILVAAFQIFFPYYSSIVQSWFF